MSTKKYISHHEWHDAVTQPDSQCICFWNVGCTVTTILIALFDIIIIIVASETSTENLYCALEKWQKDKVPSLLSVKWPGEERSQWVCLIV